MAKNPVLGNALLVAAATLLSRVAGLARDILFAAIMGSSASADAFIAAFRLPNLFRRLFAEGSFSAAFVPLYADLSGAAARHFAGLVLLAASGFLLLLTSLALMFMPALIYGLAGGFADEAKFAQAVLFGRILFPYLSAMSLAALFAAMLHSVQRFFVAALTPLLLNLGLILALLLAASLGSSQMQAGLFLSWAVSLSGLLQVLLVAFACHRAALAPNLPRPLMRELIASPPLRRFVALLLPLLATGGATQLNIIIGTRIASGEPGAIAWLYYAERLYQLPLALIGIAISLALLPSLVRYQRAGEKTKQARAMDEALGFALLLALPAASALAFIPEPILASLFFYGAFSAHDLQQSSLALAGFALGLPAFIAVKILAQGFFAQQDMRRPLLYTCAAIALNCALALSFFSTFGVLAIALATAAAAWLQAFLLSVSLMRQKLLPITFSQCWLWGRMALACLLMGLCLDALASLPFFSIPSSLTTRVGGLALLVLAGLALYPALCHMLKIPLFAQLRAALLQR